MPRTIDELLTMYDEKQISRRQLMGVQLMVSATAPLAADAGRQKPALPERKITSVMLKDPHGISVRWAA